MSRNTAMKSFQVWGYMRDEDRQPKRRAFGNFTYDPHGPAAQTFALNMTNPIAPCFGMTLQVDSNHGSDLYTCVYGFRVHGSNLFYEPEVVSRASQAATSGISTMT